MSSLNDLLKKLEVFSASENHQEVFESSFDILKNSPHDERALRLTVVSLINLDQYLKAFKILQKYNQADHFSILLEKLYIYYKLNLNKELQEEFSKLQDDQLSRGLLHLKAQFYYRTGKFPQALAIYHSLLKETSSSNPELLDLSVNERAVLSDSYQLNSSISTSPTTSLVEDSYDLLFNESLIQLGLSNHSQALKLLDIAEQGAREANQDEEDQLSETLPIILQRAFVYQLIGDKSKAFDILNSLQQTEITDGLNKLVLNNNYFALSDSINTHLAYKELSFPNSINDLSSRLSIIQRSQLVKNYLKLSLKIGKSVKPTDDILSSDVTSKTFKSLLKSGVLLDHDDLETQAKKSFKYARSSKSLEAALLAAQLNINADNIDAAINILDSLPVEEKVVPGVASSLLSLYENLNSNKKKVGLFNEVFHYYSSNEQLFKESLDIFEFLKIFSFKFWELESEKSKKLLNLLNDYHKDELITIVLNNEESTALKSIDTLTSSLDLDELIQQGIDEISKQKVIRVTSNKVTKRRIQKRKKLPESYDESKEPDPERWLPLKDRSYYRPKKSKKNKGREIQTQGGSADNTTEENLVSRVRQSTPQPKKNNKKKGRK